MKKICLFGAGKIGNSAFEFLKHIQIDIECFCDNSVIVQGTVIDGKTVLSVSELVDMMPEIEVLITCKYADKIYNQLIQLGFKEEHIKYFNTYYIWFDMFWDKLFGEMPDIGCQGKNQNRNVIFELSNGLALGGVESWSIQQVSILEKMNVNAYIMTNLDKDKVMMVDQEILLNVSGASVFLYIEDAIRKILGKLPCIFINNFNGFHLIAACILKARYGELIKVVAIVHNDEETYYDAYKKYHNYIDSIVVISDVIRRKMLNKGISSGKIYQMLWAIDVKKDFDRNYSSDKERINIGYAGRITVIQKRMDLVCLLLQKLSVRGIDYRLQIAGIGDYFYELEKFITQNGLENNVELLGLVSKECISDFWLDKDIMISCSDWEGHSITQCEAMAAGAVPIVTDVSGARDDVVDGVNGYIVEVGAVDMIVDRICYLYEHRELLPVMGKRAYETIKEKYSEEKVEALWEKILEFDK